MPGVAQHDPDLFAGQAGKPGEEVVPVAEVVRTSSLAAEGSSRLT